jgi:signal transduction histidine kinase
MIRLTIGSEHDVLALHQHGREIAAAVGLPDGEVTPFATALSEVGRQLFARLGPVTLSVEARKTGEDALEVTVNAARYAELAEELAETNRGVLALYAELDQRTGELAEANEAKDRFLANVSHELRAPVTAILGLLRLLRDPGSDPLTEEQQRQLALLQDSADTMLGLVNQLLDLAKAESGRLEPRWSTVDLHALFGALRGTIHSIAARSDPARPGVEVVVEEPVSVPVVHTDEAMLIQVLGNLMTNAVKFTERGEVRLAATPVGRDRVAFTVSDTGIGIPPEEQERIFEEFYQVRSPLNVAGTGLGLPYARRLVALLGGTLTLASEVGVGSRFTVTLPLVPDEPS